MNLYIQDNVFAAIHNFKSVFLYFLLLPDYTYTPNLVWDWQLPKKCKYCSTFFMCDAIKIEKSWTNTCGMQNNSNKKKNQ